jgi:hypothetical protein
VDRIENIYEKWEKWESTGNKTVPEKVATTRTEDGHNYDAKTGTEIQTGRKKERGTAKEEVEGPTPLWGLTL